MNKKLNSLIMLTLMLASVFAFAVPKAFAVPTTKMSLTASKTSGLAIDEVFYVTVLFRDFTGLWTWQLGLTWDKNVLEANLAEAPPYDGYGVLCGKAFWAQSIFAVLAPARSTLLQSGTVDNTTGLIFPPYAEALKAPGTGVDGVVSTDYNVAKIAFKVIGYSTGTEIGFIQTDPIMGVISGWAQYPDVGTMLLADTYENVTVSTVAAPAPYGPIARFSYFPMFPEEGSIVNFDASASTGGYDGISMKPITEWRWDWNNDAVYEETLYTAFATHVFATAADYPVTLQVYAPGATPDTDKVTHTITVLPPAMGAQIDLFCQRAPYDGKGPNVEADAFAPQELVILYAKVTYNADPVANKLVAFQVNMSNGEALVYRVAMTNGSGIAETEFRIPSNPPGLPVSDWMSWATVDVAETTVADTMPFKVGWLIYILSVTPDAASYVKGTTAHFDLEIRNIAKTTKSPLITVVIYDALGVPIGMLEVPTWDIPAESTKPLGIDLDIPMSAFVSPPSAAVYVNAFTDLPQNNGVPYCPEASAAFLIVKP
jgi:PKD repeat protein